VDGFVVYFANLLRYGKTAEIEQNAAVELCYLSPEHHQVRITGRAERVTDAELLKSLWEGNALLRKYLGSLENPELIIYVVQPQAIRYMREWELAYAEVPL
jgi:general stress protein 26